jgi:prophage DNA circulation protein
MNWFDMLQLATFRGVPFQVDGSEGSYGRKAVVHEYPLRDKPFVEDLGRKARGFTLDGFVIGPNYIKGRDALINALEQSGAGRLVHPYLGEMVITVTEFKVRETTADGGVARFSITCVEAGELAFPVAQVDTAKKVDLAANVALVAVKADFAKLFKVSGLPEFVLQAAANHLGDAISAVQELSGSMPTLPDAASTFGPQATALRSGLTGLMQYPGDLGDSMTGLVSGLSGLVDLPADALAMLRGLFTFGDGVATVPATTPSRIQQASNQRAVNALMQRAAVVEAARSASQVQFDGFNDAVSLRSELADKLDVLAEGADDDTVYQSLVDVRAAMIRDITTRGADLARSVTVTPQSTQPALVLAYALYEDAGRDASIVARNKVRHPGFVPGGRPLEVLADA